MEFFERLFRKASVGWQSSRAELDDQRDAGDSTRHVVLTKASNAPTFSEKDTLGTRHGSLEHATSYWSSRLHSVRKDPFVNHKFAREEDARAALLELPCIHIASDSGKLICTQVLIFGYYKQTDGQYEVVICGDELPLELWEEARTSFAKHGGRLKNELAPENRSRPASGSVSADVREVLFAREARSSADGKHHDLSHSQGPRCSFGTGISPAASGHNEPSLYCRGDPRRNVRPRRRRNLQRVRLTWGWSHALRKLPNSWSEEIEFRQQGQFQQALKLANEARDRALHAVGPSNQDYATCLLMLGFVHESLGHYSTAEPLYRQASEIIEHEVGARQLGIRDLPQQPGWGQLQPRELRRRRAALSGERSRSYVIHKGKTT